MRGPEVGEAEGLAVELEAVAQHVQRALEVELPDEGLDDQALQVAAVQTGHGVPLFGLRCPQEIDGARREQRPPGVPLGQVA